MTDTWNYEGPDEPILPVPEEDVWVRLRVTRDALLSDSDFRMLPDVVNDKAAWSAYRDALRDLPQNTVDPRQAVWPEPPL